MLIKTERFLGSRCKHCKTAVVVEKNLVAFLSCHRGSLRERLTIQLARKKNFGRFCENSMFLTLIGLEGGEFIWHVK